MEVPVLWYFSLKSVWVKLKHYLTTDNNNDDDNYHGTNLNKGLRGIDYSMEG